MEVDPNHIIVVSNLRQKIAATDFYLYRVCLYFMHVSHMSPERLANFGSTFVWNLHTCHTICVTQCHTISQDVLGAKYS